MDLIGQAAYKDHQFLYDGKIIPIHRGEVISSERVLMERWQWKSRGKIRRFLGVLEKSNRIEKKTSLSRTCPKTDIQTDHPVTVITICNYERYQNHKEGDGTKDGTESGTKDGQRTDRGRTKQNKGNKGNKDMGATKKRKKVLPEDWLPTDAHRTLAGKEGVDLEREVVKFRNHAAANGRLQLDWDAAFRNWIMSGYGAGSRARPPADELQQPILLNWSPPE